MRHLSTPRRVTVIATVKVNGFHHWEGAPAPVEYLASNHRHLFTFRVEVPVTTPDRQVEFHMLQGWVREALAHSYAAAPNGALLFRGRSCETLASELATALDEHDIHASAIEVWEDDECGARVEFTS